MFESLTESARQAVALAQDEARALKHNYIGTEHLLLGVLRAEDEIAAAALESLGIRAEDVRSQVARIVGSGEEVGPGQIPFTPRTKRVMEQALREALVLDHEHIGPEHVLLGLSREGEGVACRILLDHGIDPKAVRDAVIGRLEQAPPPDYEEKMEAAQRSMRRSRLLPYVPLIFATVVLFGAAVVLGIFIGWVIWG